MAVGDAVGIPCGPAEKKPGKGIAGIRTDIVGDVALHHALLIYLTGKRKTNFLYHKPYTYKHANIILDIFLEGGLI